MNNSRLTIIDTHPASRRQIEEALAREKIEGCRFSDGEPIEGFCIWIGNKDEVPPRSIRVNENDRFIRPVRLGALLDRINRVLASLSRGADKISIGPYALDLTSNELLLDHDRAVRLTDKEKQILVLLSEARGKTLSREVLLEKVWSYAPNLETHTLETHIYRLRQKIEKDPAKPDILMTDGSGYRIL